VKIEDIGKMGKDLGCTSKMKLIVPVVVEAAAAVAESSAGSRITLVAASTPPISLIRDVVSDQTIEDRNLKEPFEEEDDQVQEMPPTTPEEPAPSMAPGEPDDLPPSPATSFAAEEDISITSQIHAPASGQSTAEQTSIAVQVNVDDLKKTLPGETDNLEDDAYRNLLPVLCDPEVDEKEWRKALGGSISIILQSIRSLKEENEKLSQRVSSATFNSVYSFGAAGEIFSRR
jgi:hypothetical protein